MLIILNMKTKSIIIRIILAFILGIFISMNANSQTAGTLSFNVTTTFTGGSWGSNSNFVVWIENSTGVFVKTRILYGNELDHLQQWTSKTPTDDITDAITGATKTTNPFVYPAVIWTGNDITGSSPYYLLPDGTYNVSMELAWASSKVLGTGRQIYTASFTKGPSPQTVTPGDQTNFTGLSLQWTPASIITLTTSALSSSSYCAGSAVNVPFTKGAGTVYNNNVWTAQLSNSSGSFASPVTIGTLNGTAAGTISCTIPAGTASGTGYRIRVVGSQPTCTGTDNGTNIVIGTTPTVPTVGTITQPTCTVATGSVVLTGLPTTGLWTINPGNISGSGSSYTVTNLTANTTYNFTVSNTCGASTATGNVVINTQPALPPAPTVGVITQPTCTVASGSVILSGLPTSGTWTLTRSPGGSTTTGSGSSKTISGLATGTYTYTVTNSQGCTSLASNNIVINTQPATPTTPTIGTITQPTCNLATGSVELSNLPSGAWTITRTPGNVTTIGSGVSSTITGVPAGTYTYTVNDGICISVASANAVVNTQPATPSAPVVGAILQPTCTLATGSVTLNGLPSTGTWTLTRTPGNVTTTGNGLSTTISGLATGTYTYTVTNAYNCTSTLSANVIISSQPANPTVPIVETITQPSCNIATASVSFSGLPASGTWSITCNPGNVVTTGTGVTTTVSDIPASATYTFTVSNADGCTSSASSNVVIDAQPATPSLTNQTASIITGGTFVVSPNNVPVGTTYIWDAPSYTGGVTGGSAQSIPLTEISGTLFLTSGTGTATYIVTPTSGSCVGVPFIVTVDVSSTCEAVTIGTPIVANSTVCASTGNASFTVTANGTALTFAWQYNNGGNWVNVSNNVPLGAFYTNANTATLNLHGITSVDTYEYRCYITNCNGNNNATSNVATLTINPTPSVLTIGAITQPTCNVGTGSVEISGLPNSGTWIINPGNISGTGSTTTLSAIAAGTYNFTVTDVSTCASNPAPAVVINTPPITPTAPTIGAITQPTCSVSTGSVVLNGLPATGSWTINPGNIVGTGTSKTITGITTGITTYTVQNSDLCTSSASANVVINAVPTPIAAPSVGTITQPTCASATGSVVLNNLPTTGTWTINPGNISGFGASHTITELGAGTHNFTVTNYSGCTSAPSTNIVINPQPATLSAPILGTITDLTCTVATGSALLSGLPASGNWTLTRLPDNITTTGTGASLTITGIPTGTHNYTVSNSSECTSLASQNVVINTQPTIPAAPSVASIISPTCTDTTGSVVLYNLPISGTWTINPGNIIGTGSTTTINGLVSGTINFTVTNEVGCASLPANVVIPTHAVKPATPTITSNGFILHSSAAIGNQWYNTNGIIIGAVSQDFNYVYNNGYYVIANSGECSSDASNTITVTNAGIENIENTNKLSVYPNPVFNELFIETNSNNNNIEILNSIGQLVYKGIVMNKTVISTSDFAPGIYLLKIQTGNSIQFKKIIKK